MTPHQRMARDVIRLGITPVVRKVGFKRPGGGRQYHRDRESVRQYVHCNIFDGLKAPARLQLLAEQCVGYHRVWSLLPHLQHIDAELGDLGDSVVQIAAWVERELLPRFEAPLDLVALARLYEQQDEPSRRRSAQLWTLLGHPEEAARINGLVAAECPF